MVCSIRRCPFEEIDDAQLAGSKQHVSLQPGLRECCASMLGFRAVDACSQRDVARLWPTQAHASSKAAAVNNHTCRANVWLSERLWCPNLQVAGGAGRTRRIRRAAGATGATASATTTALTLRGATRHRAAAGGRLSQAPTTSRIAAVSAAGALDPGSTQVRLWAAWLCDLCCLMRLCKTGQQSGKGLLAVVFASGLASARWTRGHVDKLCPPC